MITNKDKYKINCFVAGPEKGAGKAKLMKTIHNTFRNVFTGIGCFEGIFSL